ncbi:MAG: GHMP kinase [Armatimonadota bacterium]
MIAVRSKAPVRVDFAGGTTDLAAFSSREGGAVVNAAISRYAYCSLRPAASNGVRITSDDLQTHVEAETIKELEYDGNLDLVKAGVRRLGLDVGLDIAVRCDAPPGSGTGSSASVGVALIGMLDSLRLALDGEELPRMSRYDIADMACELEAELGIVGGKQDQYAAALGGINYMEFYDRGRVAVRSLDLSEDVLRELEKHLVLVYGGESRLSGDTNDKMISAYERGDEQVGAALRTIKRVAQDIQRVLLIGDLGAFGELLEEETAARVKLYDQVMTPGMARLREVAQDAGAIGGKICGAGGGGCMLFYARPDREVRVRRALTEAGGRILDFTFDGEGLQVWRREEPDP